MDSRDFHNFRFDITTYNLRNLLYKGTFGYESSPFVNCTNILVQKAGEELIRTC